MHKYVFRAVGFFTGPYLAKSFSRGGHKLKHYSCKLFRGWTSHSNCTLSVSKKKTFTSRAVFANHLPRIGVLNENGDSTVCVRGGREEYAII